MPSFAFHPGFAGHSVRCNPWNPTQFLMTAANNFGVTGSGKIYIVDIPPSVGAPGQPPQQRPVQLLGAIGTSDGAFDACFSELNPSVFVAACGDGVKMYNMNQLNNDGVLPLLHNMEHQAEVSCVSWGLVSKNEFLTSSWDGTVKVFNAQQPQAAMVTFQGHAKEVYEVSPSPQNPALCFSCSGDGTWRVWDRRTSGNGRPAALQAIAHQGQIVLTIDANKYDMNIFATGSVDQTIKLWDVRRPEREVVVMPRGHEGAVRRVRFSPHVRSLLASSGYDFRVCVWDLARQGRPLTHRYEQHREFVVGLDWSLAAPGELVSASWDGLSFGWRVGQPPIPTHQGVVVPLPNAMPPPRNPNARRRPPAMGGGPMSR